MSTTLLIIDPQNDFCHPKGSLYVPGADQDMERLAGFVENYGDRIGEICVSLDSHHVMDISHPLWWVSPEGTHPQPFTTITVKDVVEGRWAATLAQNRKTSLLYLRSLERLGKYPHTIWPEHCLIGSWGKSIHKRLFEALMNWERRTKTPVSFVTKGECVDTEHFSIIKAEVPTHKDPNTETNYALVNRLDRASKILVSGEALSHCVANSVEDLVTTFRDSKSIHKVTLLTDTSSSVPGFETYGEKFISRMAERGMRVATTENAWS